MAAAAFLNRGKVILRDVFGSLRATAVVGDWMMRGYGIDAKLEISHRRHSL